MSERRDVAAQAADIGRRTSGILPLGRPDAAEGKVKTFYNGECPVCRAEMTAYGRTAAAKGLPMAFCDVAADAGPAADLGISPDQALRRLHALDPEGRLHVGFDAMLLVWRGIPRTRWLARLFRLPLVKPVAAWLYEHVVAAALYRWALRRRRLGRAGSSRGQ